MANFRLVFQGTQRSDTLNNDLEVYENAHNEVAIYLESDGIINMICLDKDTAVKFCKELKRQISYLESEVSNG
jgi:hypothetical protein